MTNILNKIFNLEITAEQILDWLSSDDPHNIVLPGIEQKDTTRIDFISYFLNYLRKECNLVLHLTANDELDSQCIKPFYGISSKQDAQNTSQGNYISENISDFKLMDSTNVDSSIDLMKSTTRSSRRSLNQSTPKIDTLNKSYFNQSYLDYNIGLNELPQSHSSPLKEIESLSLVEKAENIPLKGRSNLYPLKSMNDNSLTFNSSTASTAPSSPFSPYQVIQITPNTQPNKNDGWKKLSNKKQSPAQNSNGRQKNMKSSPNHSICLGDFLILKNSSKKKSKKTSLNQSIESSPRQENDLTDVHDTKVIPKQKSSRRIKPTKILVNTSTENQHQETFGLISRPPTGNPKFLEALSTVEVNAVTSFDNERELLKLERQQHTGFVPTPDTVSQGLPKVLKKKKNTSIVMPNVELVKNSHILDILAKLYSGFILEKFIPNPMTELYFIISLITSQYKTHNKNEDSRKNKNDTMYSQSESFERLKETMGCSDLIKDNDVDNLEELEIKDTPSKNQLNGKNNELLDHHHLYINTPHNCVYFGVKVLWGVKDLLSVFDRPTLVLLCDNALIQTYNPTLHEFLVKLYEQKLIELNNIITPYDYSRTSQSNVCFQVDTDSRDNFPSLTAFSAFRKQRDSFYKILKTWEDNRLNSKWSFQKMLGSKINSMLSMHSDIVNYYHLAQLFKSQLLVSSIDIGQIEETFCEGSLDILQSFRDLKPEKFLQLRQRLITPITSMGPVPPPSFPGIQEFYKEFILAAWDPKFSIILQDCFIQELVEHNDTQFTSSDINTKGCRADENTKQSYLWCISSSRLIAKFLGFLISLPYESKTNSLNSETTQIALRSRIMPPLDVRECLLEAVSQRKLAITVPWIVQYLAMLDPISFRLPYYLDVCKWLYCIYRDTQYSINNPNASLLAFCIGWLFELSNFPKDIYFKLIINYRKQKNELFIDIDKYTYKKKFSMSDGTENNVELNSNVFDDLHIVDNRALYICCPFLKELRILLKSENLNLNSNTANRHITPVSSKLPQSSISTRSISLESQLEDAFFHSHPRSVHRTVDFIAERIASNCVKHIYRTLIPTIKERIFEELKKTRDESSNKVTNEMLVKLIASKITTQSHEIIPETCEKKTKIAMETLLADDVLPAVTEMCTKIAVRMEKERINQWLDSYINNAMESNDLLLEFLSFRVYNKKEDEEEDEEEEEEELSNGMTRIHIDDCNAPWITSIIKDIRNSLWEILENNEQWAIISEETVLDNINKIHEGLESKKNRVPSAHLVLYRMSMDYAIHLIALKPQSFTRQVEEKFFEIWKMYDNNETGSKKKLISKLLSPRNVRIFMLSRDSTTWIIYGKFIQQLLKHNLASIEDFSDDCVYLLRHSWDFNTLKSISKCITEAIRDYKLTNESVEKIMMLLDWIIQTCGTMDSYD